MRALRRVTALLVLAVACAAPPPDAPDPAVTLPRAAPLDLPDDWARLAPEAFERWVLAALPDGVVTPIGKEDLAELQRALDQVARPVGGDVYDPLAVRAAVILGRSLHPSAAAVLVRRLEQRQLGPSRWSDAGDTVAAAALARFPDPARHALRLVPLAVGPRPHPDLEVRVECAATALHAGFTQVIPFLVQVLRIDTYAGLEDDRDFAVSPTTAWPRGRAAEALSAHARVPVTYRFDGSIADREREAERLARILLPPAERPESPAR